MLALAKNSFSLFYIRNSNSDNEISETFGHKQMKRALMKQSKGNVTRKY